MNGDAEGEKRQAQVHVQHDNDQAEQELRESQGPPR
jgi:hypothetical protein